MSTPTARLQPLDELEAESIHIFREVVAELERPVLLFSMGKDSSVLIRLARKAFHPAPIPFPLLFVDTTFKFPEAYAFWEQVVSDLEAGGVAFRHPEGLAQAINPFDHGTAGCCAVWKTRGLLDGLREHEFDAAFGGARRDEERSRAKERVFSFRDAEGRWDPTAQRPELWNLYNGRRRHGEAIRVFPLSNWSELDVWRYIEREQVPVVPLYFARPRPVVERHGALIVVTERNPALPGETPREVLCRFRSIGCAPCSGAVRSEARTPLEVIAELETEQVSERAARLIDLDRDGSMELKKREGYF